MMDFMNAELPASGTMLCVAEAQNSVMVREYNVDKITFEQCLGIRQHPGSSFVSQTTSRSAQGLAWLSLAQPGLA